MTSWISDRAPTIDAVRGTVATKGVFDNSKGRPFGGPSVPLTGLSNLISPYGPLLTVQSSVSRASGLLLSGFWGVSKHTGPQLA